MKKILKFSLTFCILILLTSCFKNFAHTTDNNTNSKMTITEKKNNIEVTAHRGASIDYPENTLISFDAAKKLGADWIELDVRETKDGKLIVIHDNNFKRTTGIDKKVNEVAYSEVINYDASKYFNKNFKNVKIPLLQEVIEYSKENEIKLNIELKPTKSGNSYVNDVIELIEQYNFADSIVISSFKYEVLEKVKEINNNIKTVYNMRKIEEDLETLDKADAFNIKAIYIDEELVNIIHNQNKKIYVWTIDTKEDIEHAIELKVDNIITNNIKLTRELVDNKN